MSTLSELWSNMNSSTIGQIGLSLLLLFVGVIYLFWGWPLYHMLLVAMVVVAGGVIGGGLGESFGIHPLLAAIPAALLAGLASLWIERFGRFAVGAMAGVGPIISSRSYFSGAHTFAFALLAAALIAGSLAVLFLEPMIVLATSVLGALCIEQAFLLIVGQISAALVERIWTQHMIGLVAAFFLMVVVGIIFQTREHPPRKADGQQSQK